jgi:hypothetical protein
VAQFLRYLKIKKIMMKKLIFSTLLLLIVIAIQAQNNKVDILQKLESNQTAGNVGATATLTSSSRLFGAKDDLTTVIMIIPSGSSVNVLGSDSTYFKVSFEENEGYIFKRHAVIDKTPVNTTKPVQAREVVRETQPVQERPVSRFTYLESKYGSNMAARLMAGKIWKGMNSEMVKDSWGSAEKVNSVQSGNLLKEEWIFRNTWLYFENNMLVEWGPIKN